MIVGPTLVLFLAGGVFVLSLCFFRPKLGVCLSVFMLPGYWVPESFSALLSSIMTSSQIPIFADAMVIATFVGVLVFHPRHRPLSFRSLSVGMALFVICSVLSVMNTPDLLRSVSNIGSYVQLGLMAYVVEALCDTQADLERFLQFWIVSLGAVLLAGLFGIVSAYAGWENFSVMSGQVRATFRFPNQLSLYLVVTSAIISSYVVSRSISRGLRRLVFISIPLIILVLAASGSRSGAAAMAAATCVLMVFHGRRGQLRIPVALTVGLFGLWIAVVTIDSDSLQLFRDRYGMFSEMISGRDTSELEFYSSTNDVAWRAFLAHPIIGSGVGAVVDTQFADLQSYEIHNTYFGLLGQVGALGCLACLWIIGLVVRNLVDARRKSNRPFVRALAEGSLAALVGCGVHAWGNFDWRLRHLWLFLALSSVVRSVALTDQRSAGAQATPRLVSRRANFRPRIVARPEVGAL